MECGKMKVILASNNNGKIREFKEILGKYNIEVLSLKELGFTGDIIEDGNTFMENALIKAKAIYDIYNLPVIADDSGICVLALNGAPGIYSARYGDLGTDTERTNFLLHNMENVSNREAYFHCSFVFYISKDNYKHFEGKVYGTLDFVEKGENGFGYDSIFIPNGYDKTFGQLDSEIKNKISHRALALKSFMEYIENDFNN